MSIIPIETPPTLDLDTLWNSTDPNSSEIHYRQRLRDAENSANDDHSELIEILTQIARSEGAQGRLDEATSTLARAESLLDTERSSYRVSAKIRWLLEIGRLNILRKTPSQARPKFMEAWTLASHSGEDYFAIDAAIMMAVIEPVKLQQEWLVRAIKIAENSPQPSTRRFLGTLYASLGWKLFDLRQYEPALDVFQKALSHLKVHGSERETFVARWSVGKLLRVLGKTEEALAIQNALLAELGIGGRKDGRLYEELAECLQTLKRAPEAQPYFELAYRELAADPWIVDNQAAMLKRLKDLGKVK